MKALSLPYVLCFEQTNPGYDILIISPSRKEPRKTHLTFIEVRYSASQSETSDRLAKYKSKYASVSEAMASLRGGLKMRSKSKKASSNDVVEIEWHFVFATFRDTNIGVDQVHNNTILLDRSGLRTFYGRSMSSLGML